MLVIDTIDNRLNNRLKVGVVYEKSRLGVDLAGYFHYHAVAVAVKMMAGVAVREMEEAMRSLEMELFCKCHNHTVLYRPRSFPHRSICSRGEKRKPC